MILVRMVGERLTGPRFYSSRGPESSKIPRSATVEHSATRPVPARSGSQNPRVIPAGFEPSYCSIRHASRAGDAGLAQ
jgi:hypothetical protein